MKLRLIFSLLAMSVALHAQGPLLEPVFAPEFQREQDGMFSKIDFSIPLDDLAKSGLTFKQFEKKPLVILYMSATCGHCHIAYPKVSKMASEYKTKGVEMLVIASSFSNVDDLRDVGSELKVKEPFFHDKQKHFGQRYGVGSVPLIVLVDAQGRYITIRSFGADQEQQARSELTRWFAADKK